MLQLFENIKQARLNKGFTQQYVADKLKVKRTTYANWEVETEPDLTKIMEISQILEVGFDQLIHGKVEPSTYTQKRLNKKLAQEKNDDITVYQPGTKASFINIYDDENKDTPIGKLNSSVFPGCDHAEKVNGDSMYPMINNQAVVVGEKILDPGGISSGDKYVIHTKRGLRTCKYVHTIDKQPEYIKLVALNKNVPPQTIPIEDIILIMRVHYIINPS
jgi:transcriptional regulator with XRE-family HTH domain